MKVKVKQCACGQYFEGRAEKCHHCREISAKKTNNPLYNTWTVNYNKQWENYEDFYREVGEPPSLSHVLRPRIAGTPISPGNVKWSEVDRLENLKLHKLTPVEEMLDPELRRLAAQAFQEIADTPISKISTLRQIERET